MSKSDSWIFDQLKQGVSFSIAQKVGEGAKVHAENIENDNLRENVKNAAENWGEKIYNMVQITVLVLKIPYAFDKFFSFPEMDISLFGIGDYSYFLIHSGTET